MSNTDTEPTVEFVNFRSAARILNIVGADLIKDERAGVLELVKNAYDADASAVEIRFVGLDGEAATIEILDEGGTGMTREVLLEHWLVPATYDKGHRKRSERGRALLGRKGVGRFACMRVGESLELQTSPRGSRDLFVLTVDWRVFGDPEDDSTDEDGGDAGPPETGEPETPPPAAGQRPRFLEAVKIELKTHHETADVEGSTRLIIGSLQDTWDEDRLADLYRELRLLLPAHPETTDEDKASDNDDEAAKLELQAHDDELLDPDDFEIRLDLTRCGLASEVVRRFRSPVLPFQAPQIADYVVSALVAEDGGTTIRWERRVKDGDEVERKRDWSIARIQRKLPNDIVKQAFGYSEASALPESDADIPPMPCGPFRLEMYIWDGDKEIVLSKAGVISDAGMGSLGLRDLRSTLRRLSGVGIYRDGFRVRPYGDADQDWLVLDSRRVQNAKRHLGPNQLRGSVFIGSDQNPDLADRSSREGLKDNTAFVTLRGSILTILDIIEPLRVRFRERHGLGRPRPKSTRRLSEERSKIMESIRSTVSSHMSGIANEKALGQLKQLDKAMDAEHERLQAQARGIQDVHALGLLARYIVHEGRNIESALDTALDLVEDDLGELDQRKEVQAGWAPSEDFIVGVVAAREADTDLRRLMDDLDPLTRPRRKRRPHLRIRSIIDKAVDLLRPLLQRANVTLALPDADFKVLAWEADVLHIVHNLLHNAIYWVAQKEGRRCIDIELGPDESKPGSNTVALVVRDNGPGVQPEDASDIFEIGVSGRGGYGMGLFIAKEAAERSHAHLSLATHAPDGAVLITVFERA